MSDPQSPTAQLQEQVRLLEQDRNHWRRQHDFVMDDWKSDAAAWAVERRTALHASDRYRAKLGELLRFYDPETGAVCGRVGAELLSEAFNAAHVVYNAMLPPADIPE